MLNLSAMQFPTISHCTSPRSLRRVSAKHKAWRCTSHLSWWR